MEHNGEWTEIINSEYILKGLDTMGFIIIIIFIKNF